MERSFSEFDQSSYWHVYNRGVDKRKIFMSASDERRFVDYLFAFNDAERKFTTNSFSKCAQPLQKNSSPYVKVMAFCLMPNHFHLLLEQVTDGGISEFMARIGNGYTKYFNIRHARMGRLFERPFQRKPVVSTNYLMHLTRYIHLNPLELLKPNWKKQKDVDWDSASKFLEQYQWSSYMSYAGTTSLPCLDKGLMQHAFASPREYENFVKEWATRDVPGANTFLFN